MRIIRMSDLPAVVLVKGPGVCAVAIPDGLPSHEVLELASLVLSTTEYEEVRDAIKPGAGRTPAVASKSPVSMDPQVGRPARHTAHVGDERRGEPFGINSSFSERMVASVIRRQ